MDLYLIILMFDMLESLESISGLISAAAFAFASFLGIITFIRPCRKTLPCSAVKIKSGQDVSVARVK